MKGIELEAREAAKDAARRAGLTLGQWLNQRILDDDEGEPSPHRLVNLGPTRGGSGRAEVFESRLDSLSRRIDTISDRQPNVARRRPDDRSARREHLDPQFGSLEARFERTDEQLGMLHDDVAMLANRFDAASAGSDVESVVALERALTNVVDHIELTDRRNGEVLKTIQARLSELAARSPGGPEAIDGKSRAAILTLEDRVSDLAERLENADRIPGIDQSALERKHADLARKIEKAEENAQRNPAIEQLDSRVAQLTSKLVATERMMAAQTDVNSLRSEVGKLRDDVARAREPSKPAVVQALESRLNTVSSEVAALRSNAAPNSALSSLNGRLDQVLSRLDQAEPAVKAASRIGSLEHSLTDLAERLDQAIKADPQSHVHPRIADLENKFEEFAVRFEGAPERPIALPALQELEDQVAAIADRLDNTEQHFGTLRSIESNLAQLYESLEGSRSAAVDAAEQAAFNAVRRIVDAQAVSDDATPSTALMALERGLAEVKTQNSASDTRNHETLEAIHDTLKRVIERLGVLEENTNGGVTLEKPAIEPASAVSEAFGDFRLPPLPDFKVPAASPTVNIEPPVTSGRPDLAPIAADTPDPATFEADEAETAVGAESSNFAQAYDAPAPSAPRNEDFIAAARRAAQAANDGLSEPSSRRGRGAGDDDQDDRGGLFRGRRRTLLFAAAALFLAAGALSVSGLLGRGSGNSVIPMVSSILAPLDRSGAQPSAAEDGEEASATHNAANYFGAIEAVTPVPQRRNDRLAEPAEQPAPTGALATKVTTAPDRAKSLSGETVLEPRGAGIDESATEFATIPAHPQAPLGTDIPTEFENTEQNPADGEMMTAIAIDPVPARELPLVLPTGEPELAAAAAGGDPLAQFEIGARYADGRAGEKNLVKAAQWYQRAAAQGLAPAQYRLGALYEKGQGVASDKGAALIWYQRAAEQGNVKAMHNLAVLLAGGTDGTPDYARAARWFVKAAEFGLADSQFNLAILHERGLGVERDPMAAYKWFAIAAASGDQEAESRMDGIAAQLDAPSLARASTAAKSWRPKPLNRDSNVVELPAKAGEAFASALNGDRVIAKAQRLLATLGYDPGPADGMVGPRTSDAVVAFERERGLPESGIVTPTLVEVLEAAIAG